MAIRAAFGSLNTGCTHSVLMALGLSAALWALPAAAASASEYCFPQIDLAIANVHYRDGRAAVERAIGKPHRVRIFSVPGSAGPYRVEQQTYRGLSINLKLASQEVEMIVATGSGAVMPNGVKVGATIADVSQRLRYNVEQALSEDLVWTPSLCERGPYDWIFVGPQFIFAKKNGAIRLQSIEIKRM
ncbi:hypothetical protein [Pandoraea apista]|uniref:hypothetical protein n=1 Tax=Pandoraea apista TaxID=93218 RepID=UPI000F664621|nr:hypothetical protein [Pandoraea apista]